MAGIKISQLDSVPGGTVTSIDQLPVARGDSTFRISAGQFVVDGVNIGVGPGQFYSDKTAGAGTTLLFRTLSAEEGLSIRTSGSTIVISASGQNPSKTSFVGNGVRTTWPINDAKSINANNYRVTIDGVVQEPLADYSINGTNIVFSDAPPLSGNVAVISNNLVRAFDIIPSDGSVTTNKLALSAVTTSTINNNAVTTEKINTEAITNSRIAFDGGSFCFRNKIINGAMNIWQRGTSFTNPVSPTIAYTADRMVSVRGSWTTGITTTQSTDAPTGFRYSLKQQRIAGNTSTSDFQFHYTAETADTIELQGKTVTFSFYAKTGANYSGGVFAPQIITGTTTDQSYLSLGTLVNSSSITLTTSWNRYTLTGTIPTNATQWRVTFNWIPTGTAGVDDSVYITGLQLEVGSTATPFEYRPIQTELTLCQRYFQVFGSTFAVGNAASSNIRVGGIWYTPFRASPVITYASNNSAVSVDAYGWTSVQGTGGYTQFASGNAEL